MGMPGPWELLIILAQMLGLGGAGVPLGAPPQQPRPELYSIAPDDCLLYMTSYGAAEADPNSPNETEQLIAEPEVQAFLAEIERTFSQFYVSDPAQGEVIPQDVAFEFVKAGLANPWAVSIDDLDAESAPPLAINARFVIYLDEDASKLEILIQAMLENMNNGIFSEEGNSDQLTVYAYQGREESEIVRWAFVDGYMLLGVGPGVFEDMLAQFQNQSSAPDWLTEGLASFDIPRPSTFLYVNTEQLVRKGETEIPGDALDMFRDIQEKVGITNLQRIVAVSGFDEVAFVEEVHMQFDGPPQGLLGGLTSGGLTEDALSIVPSDANLAAAYSVDVEEVLALILQMADLAPQSYYGPSPSEIVSSVVQGIEMQTGVNLVEDLLPLLGDSIVLYNSPSEGGTFFTGLTLAVDIRDVEQFQTLHDKIHVKLFGESEELVTQTLSINNRDVQFYFLDISGLRNPFNPTWCIHEGRLWISFIPQNLRAVLARGDDFESLSYVLQEDGSEPCLYMRADGKDLLESFYPFLLYGAYALRSQGIVSNDLAMSIPSLSTITRHVQPTECVITMEDDLLIVRTTKTFPASTMTTIPLLFGFLAPVANVQYPATGRVQSMNNMKMIGLALHNYVDSHNSLPPAYTVDEDGNPLLSWRVLILPYLEESALYDQFHLDEPWDSPHNLPLSNRVVETYRSPLSDSDPFMTTYLTVRDPRSVFPGAEGVEFASITDGLWNTVMVVEASDEEAVNWSKPDDFVPKFDEPGWEEGLICPLIDGTLVLMGDCSVRFIEPVQLKEKSELMFDRADGLWHLQ